MNQHHSNQTQLEELFERHYGLLVSQAISFKPPTKADLDDYIQIAAIGMMNAYKNYDEKRAKFSTYAICCIRNAIKNHLRGQKKFKSDVVLDFQVAAPTQENLADYLPDTLTQSERKFVLLKVAGWTAKEISEDSGLPIHRVHKILNNAYEKIRDTDEKSLDGE